MVCCISQGDVQAKKVQVPSSPTCNHSNIHFILSVSDRLCIPFSCQIIAFSRCRNNKLNFHQSFQPTGMVIWRTRVPSPFIFVKICADRSILLLWWENEISRESSSIFKINYCMVSYYLNIPLKHKGRDYHSRLLISEIWVPINTPQCLFRLYPSYEDLFPCHRYPTIGVESI